MNLMDKKLYWTEAILHSKIEKETVTTINFRPTSEEKKTYIVLGFLITMFSYMVT